MKLHQHRHLLAAVLLVAGSAALLAGCMGVGGSTPTSSTLRQARVATTAQSLADASQQPIVVATRLRPANRFQAMDEMVLLLRGFGFNPRVIIDAGANVGAWTRIATQSSLTRGTT